jgi:hypothetical protein
MSKIGMANANLAGGVLIEPRRSEQSVTIIITYDEQGTPAYELDPKGFTSGDVGTLSHEVISHLLNLASNLNAQLGTAHVNMMGMMAAQQASMGARRVPN